jgi:phosphate transport system permease protein
MSKFSNDRLLLAGLCALAGTAAVILLLIAMFVAAEALPGLRKIGVVAFFTDVSWHPDGDATKGKFGLVPMIAGSLLATGGAVLLAGPLGLASALLCRFYAPPWIASSYRRLIELMAGLPSVAYGLWGLVILAPAIRLWHPPGQSLIAATLILALMILPTLMLLADAALGAVPVSYLRGAAALGLSRTATVLQIAIPAARAGLFAAVVLAACRALGETLAVLMVAGNVVQLPSSVFDPVRTLTANIALELGYAAGDHRSALFVSGLVLLIVSAALVLLSQKVTRFAEGAGRG